MDIRKARIILIILFFLLNLVLLSMIVFSGNSSKVSRNILDNVYELFEKNGKTIACEIPDNISPLPQLDMHEEIMGGRIQTSMISSDIMGFDTDKYEPFFIFDDHTIHAEKYKGMIILENRIVEFPEYADYVNREIEGFEKSNKNIIPAYAVLLKEYLNSDVKRIDMIKMAYLKYADEEIVGPVWIISADGKIRFFRAFEAFNGLEMSWEYIS